MFSEGNPVYGTINNAVINAGAGVEIVWKDSEGNTIALAVGDRVIIYDIIVNNRGTAKDVTIYQDTDSGADFDAAEQIVALSFAAAGIGWVGYARGRATKRLAALAQKFYALGSAIGSVDVTIAAEIVRS